MIFLPFLSRLKPQTYKVLAILVAIAAFFGGAQSALLLGGLMYFGTLQGSQTQAAQGTQGQGQTLGQQPAGAPRDAPLSQSGAKPPAGQQQPEGRKILRQGNIASFT